MLSCYVPYARNNTTLPFLPLDKQSARLRNMEFILTHPDAGTKTITVLFDGVPYETDSTNQWWEEIVDLVLEDDSRVLDLFPIRPVQQPSVLIEEEPDDEPIFSPSVEEDITPEAAELAVRRYVFDVLGFPRCGESHCVYCYGPRA